MEVCKKEFRDQHVAISCSSHLNSAAPPRFCASSRLFKLRIHKRKACERDGFKSLVKPDPENHRDQQLVSGYKTIMAARQHPRRGDPHTYYKMD